MVVGSFDAAFDIFWPQDWIAPNVLGLTAVVMLAWVVDYLIILLYPWALP